jgi:hypothetical protein
MMQALKARLPAFKEALPVYAVLVFILYGWATIALLWKLPAWLFYLKLSEIGVVYAYGVVNEFVESVIYAFLIIALAAALPASFLKNKFQTRGTLIAVFLLGVIYLTSYLIAFHEVDRVKAVLIALALFGALDAILFWLTSKISFLDRAVIFITDQMPVFLYVYAPITVISASVILFRLIG